MIRRFRLAALTTLAALILPGAIIAAARTAGWTRDGRRRW